MADDNTSSFVIKKLTGNDKRKESCKKVGGGKKRIGHKREDDFNRKYNPEALGTTEYGAKSDCIISPKHQIIPIIQEKFGLSSYNKTS